MHRIIHLFLLIVVALPSLSAAQGSDDLGRIDRHGGEGEAAVKTNLSSRGLQFETDGFSLRLSSWVQFRFTHQQEVANGNDGTNGRNFNNFRVRNAKTTMQGHIFQKEFQYRVTMNWVAGGDAIIERAFFRWAPMREFNLNAGQSKIEWNREYSIGAARQNFAERGYVNSVFNLNYAKGIWADGSIGDDAPLFKYWAGIFNSRLRGNNDFRNRDNRIISDSFSDGVVDNNLTLSARVETQPLGAIPGTLYDRRGEEAFDKPLIVVGLGVNYFISSFDNENLRPDTAGTPTASGRSRTWQDTWAINLDVNVHWYGAALLAALKFRHTEFHNRGSNDFNPGSPSRNGISNLTDVAVVVEASYFVIPRKMLVALRWNYLDADEFWGNGTDRRERSILPDVHEVGLSANWFFHAENLRLTFDLLHVSQQLTYGENPGTSTSLRGVYNSPPVRGAFGGSGGSDYNNLWIIRLQLQWMF